MLQNAARTIYLQRNDACNTLNTHSQTDTLAYACAQGLVIAGCDVTKGSIRKGDWLEVRRDGKVLKRVSQAETVGFRVGLLLFPGNAVSRS